jgi:hypothetical protein
LGFALRATLAGLPEYKADNISLAAIERRHQSVDYQQDHQG